MDIVSGIVGVIGSIFGGGKKKKTKAELDKLNQAVNILAQENQKQTKTITFLMIGLGALALVVVLVLVMGKRRK